MTKSETHSRQTPWLARLSRTCAFLVLVSAASWFFTTYNVLCWNGREIKHYAAGGRMSESNYRCGRREGLTRWWEKDGALRREASYSKGRLHGLEMNWSRGSLTYATTWDHGERIIQAYYWRQAGSEVTLSGTFKDGREWEGQFVRYVNGPAVLTFRAGERTAVTPLEGVIPDPISEPTREADRDRPSPSRGRPSHPTERTDRVLGESAAQ